MLRCIELARMGAGKVSPNPLVGAVVVHNEQIIGEGWHQAFGEPHAEVNAIRAVRDPSLLPACALYVNLEPCSHHGKTPPCADLIIEKGIKRVVVGMIDPFELVAGTGIRKLRAAGIEVTTGVAEPECLELNKRFITAVTKKRPYVILKWAQTTDRFLSPDASAMTPEAFEEKRHITGFTVQKLVHRWRTEEDAIMVGTNTVISDNPALNARAWSGRNPVRVVIDKDLRIPRSAKIYDGSVKTILFTSRKETAASVTYEQIDFSTDIIPQIMQVLYREGIHSLIIEGGAHTLNSVIRSGIWDEAQVFTTPAVMVHGVKAPDITGEVINRCTIDQSELVVYRNTY